MRCAVCLALVVGLVSAAASPVAAAPEEGPVIEVVGTGHATQEADSATLEFHVRGEGKSSAEALRALSDRREAVESALEHLAGATTVDVRSSRVAVVPLRGAACNDQARDNPPSFLAGGPCATIGYLGEIKTEVRVSPVSMAGNAASLAAEKGAEDVELSGAEVADPGALRAAASKLAMADGRRQAETIATASGGRLGPLIRVRDNDGRYDSQPDNTLVVTAERREATISPSVVVGYHPPPVQQSVSYTLTYRLER